ncbi:butyrophilin subfamily 1 member A1-like [Platysternon megacephalum]|uniref:Butyrophilin subfamily 1 member A1-like n=1 Tax=Platysternon megacephalum TaxID=55544 RepID=A0A4D9ECS8_9SAUR|nr:butyrophilin subfamily 1 member A1-like [Platysternon megacephalum]
MFSCCERIHPSVSIATFLHWNRKLNDFRQKALDTFFSVSIASFTDEYLETGYKIQRRTILLFSFFSLTPFPNGLGQMTDDADYMFKQLLMDYGNCAKEEIEKHCCVTQCQAGILHN